MSTVFLAPVVFFNAPATRLFLVSLKYLYSTKNISRVSANKSGQRTLSTGFFMRLTSVNLTWDQALFSFRFVNNIPAGMVAVAVRENVWEPLKLGLISG